MYNIHMNDVEMIENCEMQLFADDTMTICETDSILAVERMMQEDLNSIQNWL